jgi:3-mercaptopyruvate sulfurtransferase SseA
MGYTNVFSMAGGWKAWTASEGEVRSELRQIAAIKKVGSLLEPTESKTERFV